MSALVIFRCGGLRCGMEDAAVNSVAPIPTLSHPPGLPASVEGFLTLDGEALPVVDVARLFNVAPDPDVDPIYRHILILDQGAGHIGLLVDRVEDVRKVDLSKATPASPEQTLNGCVVGEVEVLGEIVHLVDPARILLAAEKARIAALRDAEQARLDALASA